jgi:hypothetical protein
MRIICKIATLRSESAKNDQDEKKDSVLNVPDEKKQKNRRFAIDG